MSYDNTNTGALFKNDRKEQATHADYRGSINVNGVEYWLNAWIKPVKSDPAKRFMSLSVKPKEARAPTPPARQPAPPKRGGSGFDDLDNDLDPPF
jgi:hypothetical protein